MQDLHQVDDSIARAADNLWLLLCGSTLMFMHIGFAMVESGTCRARNASESRQNLQRIFLVVLSAFWPRVCARLPLTVTAEDALIKNILSLCVGTLGWWSFGWGFAKGTLFQGLLGTSGFFSSNLTSTGPGQLEIKATLACETICPTSLALWFFNWAFCTTASTIVSGAVLERTKSSTYSVYTFLMSAFLYPPIVAWTWSGGWLTNLFDVGYTDFAGSCIVHVAGGIGALVGAATLGPRLHRFDKPDTYEPHNLPMVVLGTLFLWVGWYAFNTGSTVAMHDKGTAALAAQVAVNTVLAGSSGGTTLFLVRLATTKKYDVTGMCNGILAGVVSITAGCSNMHAGSALVVAATGGIVYAGFSSLLKKLKVDDPVDASSVHLACGVWGTLAATLFDWGSGLDYYHGRYGWACFPSISSNGLPPACLTGVVGTALIVQLILILCVVVWIGLTSWVIFKILTAVAGLRVREDTEETGLDAAVHAQSKAYAIEERESPDSWRVLWA